MVSHFYLMKCNIIPLKNIKNCKKVLTLWLARGIIVFVAKKSDKDKKEFKKIRKKLLTKTE